MYRLAIWLRGEDDLRLLTTNYIDTPTVHKLIPENIAPGTTVMSDNYKPYRTINESGYDSRG